MQVKNHSQGMEAVSDYARGETARSLTLLKEIDGTIDAMIMIRKQLDALAGMFESQKEKIMQLEAHICEKETIPALEQSQDTLSSMYEFISRGLDSAKNSIQLNHDDGVVDAYEDVLESIVLLNSTIEQVRWAMLEHNADMDPPHKPLILSGDDEVNTFLDSL